jgi:DNA-binding MarR family transcriptional regulator
MRQMVENARLEQAWLALSAAHAVVTAALSRKVEVECGMPLTWLGILYQLGSTPERRFRMHELASACHTSRSGLTRLVDRIEARGLVRREAIPGDRRSFLVVLTDSGAQALAEAGPVLEAGLRESFGDRIADAELTPLLEALRRVASDGAPVCG